MRIFVSILELEDIAIEAAEDALRSVLRRASLFEAAAYSATRSTAGTVQSCPERPIHTRLDLIVRIARRRPPLLLHRLRVPQVDMQTLDLFDQQQNRFSARAEIMIPVGTKTRAPGAKQLDLVLIQPIAQGCLRVLSRRLPTHGVVEA